MNKRDEEKWRREIRDVFLIAPSSATDVSTYNFLERKYRGQIARPSLLTHNTLFIIKFHRFVI